MKTYRPGSHVIATLESKCHQKIIAHESFRNFIEPLVQSYKLKQLGAVYYDFVPGGFTAVICLSESHISIHTWPEYNKVNLDVYLSNFLKENDGTVYAIFEKLVTFFEGNIIQQQKIIR